jgi:mycothiol synthase
MDQRSSKANQLFMRRPDLEALPPLPDLADGLVLRDYGPDDLPGLAALLTAAFADAGWTENRVRERLVDAPDVVRTIVIVEGTEVVATASARLLPERYPASGYVHWVAASPARSGRRLGWIVSLAVLHEFARLGCRDAVLETDDFRLAAVKTYRSLGFVPELRDETHAERWAAVRAY